MLQLSDPWKRVLIQSRSEVETQNHSVPWEKFHTAFQPSGSKHAVIFVLIPGNGPGSLVTLPPHSLIASAVL